MNGERVGTWSVLRGEHVFDYDADWLHSPRFRALSLSLPFTGASIKGDGVGWFFDNLLPDNPGIRQRIQARFKTRQADAFSLLEAIGRDCVGAVQLMPGEMEPQGWNRIQARPLQEGDVAAILRNLQNPLQERGVDDGDFRISLAGAQEKTALLHTGNQWWLPQAATPTTHILKLPLGNVGGSGIALHHSVENEWLCSCLIAALGLPIAQTDIGRFEEQTALVVQRFDRAWARTAEAETGDYLLRIPQEDMCQTFGIPAALKYQADGGPQPERILELLGQSSNAADRSVFALSQFAFWLLAAPDGHAKNFSIFLERGGSISMTPLYDVLSMFPYMGSKAGQVHARKLKLAMRLPHQAGGDYAMQSIQTRHWQRFAHSAGGEVLWQRIVAMGHAVDGVLEQQQARLPANFPTQVWETIAHGMREQARRFLAPLKSSLS